MQEFDVQMCAALLPFGEPNHSRIGFEGIDLGDARWIVVKEIEARANKKKIAHDRGRRKHSTVCIELPTNRGVLSPSGSLLMLILVRSFTAGSRKADHQEYSDEADFQVFLDRCLATMLTGYCCPRTRTDSKDKSE